MKDTLTGWNTIDPTKKKRCTKCGVVKYLTEFKKDRRRCVDGTRNVCTLCYTKQDKRSKMLREQWLSAGKVIPNVCEVCGKKSNPNDFSSRIVCDHDHETGEFRGWICDYCNRSIGGLGDNIEGLQEAILYLQGKKKSVVEYIATPLTEVIDET